MCLRGGINPAIPALERHVLRVLPRIITLHYSLRRHNNFRDPNLCLTLGYYSGRVADGARLKTGCTRKGITGSNPVLSAKSGASAPFRIDRNTGRLSGLKNRVSQINYGFRDSSTFMLFQKNSKSLLDNSS